MKLSPSVLNRKIKITKSILDSLEKELPNILESQIENLPIIKEKRKKLIHQIKLGKIDREAQFEILGKYEILEKFVNQDGNSYGPYYYLRWWDAEKQKTQNVYLGKEDPRPLIEEIKEKQKQLKSSLES